MHEVPGMRRAVEDRRAALDLTPTEFAQAAGLTLEGLARVRRGERRRYQEKTTRGVARALAWPVDWYDRLVAGEDSADFPSIHDESAAPARRDDELTALKAEVADLKKVVARLARAIDPQRSRPGPDQ